MKLKVYLETSVVSYFTGRPSRDLIVAARQQQTHYWWDNRISAFDVFTSKMVWDEAGDGDYTAAQKRLHAIREFPILDLTEECYNLAKKMIKLNAIPPEYPEDALHIAVSTLHGMDFILTWNFTHINNAQTKRKIEKTIRDYGYECPLICTPEELMGE